MISNREEGPVYYREIQKNAYLKRIPSEPSGKLRPLGHKKPPLKAMWTLFCVHNGRTPFLEQYPSPESPATLTHKPAWRACLKTARHVTASVKPHMGDEYDFLVDTDQGPVRMLAPDWESMQDWVTLLRNKLHELKILSKGENVYTAPAAPPAPPAPRAGTRDPTSPLPPTPPVPPDRVPGIELTIPSRALEPEHHEQPEEPAPTIEPTIEPIDISNWDEPEPFTSLPSTSQDIPKTTKICGQNICLDDSVLRRNNTDSDEEFFAEIDRISEEVENTGEEVKEYKQTVVVEATAEETPSDYQGTNITVIQVSNKEPPHTAIPVLGPETNVFNFDLQQLSLEPKQNYINIVNTETEQNGYGTVYKESDYGHISLTTTVNLNGDKSIYERLCQASTSTDRSPLPVRRIKALEKVRKSSLPNMETYEYLYPSNSANQVQVEVNSENCVNGDSVTVSVDSSVRVVRPPRPVERSHSNACERTQSPKRERNDKNQDGSQGKPIWKRGLTELSLLSRLRGLGQGRRQDSPTRHDDDRSATVAVKVVRRSRPEGRLDGSRRRSSSLSNDHSPPSRLPPGLRPLRQRQAAALRAEQRRGAAVASSIPTAHPPTFVDYNRMVWVAKWGGAGAWCGGRAGDRVAALRGTPPRDAQHARTLFKEARTRTVDILFHRVPLGKIYVLNKRDHEKLGIKLDSECNITSVEPHSVCARAALPPPGRWALTEVNNQPLSLLKGCEEEMNRIAAHGTEVSVLIQPSALVKKIRAALKPNKTLLGLR
ncbi:uncharacterized protein LOC133532366 isoform X2 [Cydia pomonella]|uniref:uncharacterized protein LOC133532366 isoform X2 n=1 Tax=Cydia pomonella TaxID=82600 RepID=UPI002ADDB4F8|nr:uncharacterized protein LOC133532366 isoform X2 [Cydia pomonella]